MKDYLWQQSAVSKRPVPNKYFRLAIDRAFSVKGTGLIVTGSVLSGSVRQGQNLILWPQQKTLKIRSIHRQNQPSTFSHQGDRCALNMVGSVALNAISRGHWLASTTELPYSTRMDVALQLLASETKPLKHWTPIHVHLANQHVSGRVVLLIGRTLAPGTWSKDSINPC